MMLHGDFIPNKCNHPLFFIFQPQEVGPGIGLLSTTYSNSRISRPGNGIPGNSLPSNSQVNRRTVCCG